MPQHSGIVFYFPEKDDHKELKELLRTRERLCREEIVEIKEELPELEHTLGTLDPDTDQHAGLQQNIAILKSALRHLRVQAELISTYVVHLGHNPINLTRWDMNELGLLGADEVLVGSYLLKKDR